MLELYTPSPEPRKKKCASPLAHSYGQGHLYPDVVITSATALPLPPPPPPQQQSAHARFYTYPTHTNAPPPPPPPPPTIERLVRLPALYPARKAALLHHAAAPHDLASNLWLLKHGEDGAWYPRPGRGELGRMARPERAGLGADVVLRAWEGGVAEGDVGDGGGGVCKVWVGDVLRGEEGVEEEEGKMLPTWSCGGNGADDDEDDDDGAASDASSSPSAAAHSSSSSRTADDPYITYLSVVSTTTYNSNRGTPLFRLERTGSRNAALAAAYHNAAVRGWSTVFTCVVRGGVELELAEVRGGVEAFRRVRGVGELLGGGGRGGGEGGGGRVRVFY
ncbi:uncharacterized protein K452DRAFT_284619 [Aplosporella prunicola CBS 121167]|uniref:Uncharacterized protein n=1 Tax=Aplosporella prunicola CBS 121167 TaxID=1176127 RepID=A0A6A6BPQ5_9PEZI|nr:uncharacterized protein K452DRAFT_284619 [Aplosporella prunicola CBS 121167]KAF2145224.1 hypothetical protein K452DRAFT_284619 [Aplosporella prunicola CBS 121167]